MLFTAGVTRVAYSDASNSGYVVEFGKEVAQGQWSADEARLSSSWRELKAVHNVLEAFAPKLRGNTVKWFTDNQSSLRQMAVRKGICRMELVVFFRLV